MDPFPPAGVAAREVMEGSGSGNKEAAGAIEADGSVSDGRGVSATRGEVALRQLGAGCQANDLGFPEHCDSYT